MMGRNVFCANGVMAKGMPSLWAAARDLRVPPPRRSSAARSSGATLKELMARLGHSSVRTAMIYQHATRDRDQAIAKALGTFVRDVQNATEKLADNPERGRRELEPDTPYGTCVARRVRAAGEQDPIEHR
jgi:hypothetical protein